MTSEITVLLPTQRVDRMLDSAVNSVLTQLGVDFRLLLLLDGPKACELPRWADDERVIVIEQSGTTGLAALLNLDPPRKYSRVVAEGSDLV